MRESLLYKSSDEKPLLRRLVENMDWVLFGVIIFLLATGMVSVYSATLRYGTTGFFARQGAAVLMGLVGMIFMASINYQLFNRAVYPLYITATIMLMMVLVFGTTIRGTKGWFNLGYFAFQPVEVTKLMFVLVLAGYLDTRWRELKRWSTLVFVMGLLLGQILLILLQPDFSSSLVYFPVTLVLLYVVGIEPLYILGIFLLGGLATGIPLMATFFRLQPALLLKSHALAYLVNATNGGFPAVIIVSCVVALIFIVWWFLKQFRVDMPLIYAVALSIIFVGGVTSSGVVQHSLKEYQRKRLVVFLNPDIDPLGSGYNIIQSKIAIGSGRLFGKGLFSGTQSQLGFLPEQHTDFIFSVIGEETGFFFTACVVACYFILVWRAMIVAREARDRFGSLIAIGVATIFTFYGLINMGMVMGMMPCTGMPLPLLSYGGSCTVSALLAVGLLFSVHIRRFTH